MNEFQDPEARQALDQQTDGVVRGTEQAVDRGDGPDAIQVRRPGVFQLRVARRNQADQLIRRGCDVIHQVDRARLSDGQRDGGLRVDDHAPQRQNRHLFGKLDCFPFHRLGVRLYLLRLLFLQTRKNGRQEHILDRGVRVFDPVEKIHAACVPAGSSHAFMVILLC